jgi:hypothetical protein
MRRLTTIVVTPPTQTALTTAAAVKAELPGVTPSQALRIPGRIEQASGIITGYLGRKLARATVMDTFAGGMDRFWSGALVLSRMPIATLTSVALNGVNQDLTMFEYDESGLIYRQGYAYALSHGIGPGYGGGLGSRIQVTYDGGYLLPGQTGRDLPYEIERACIDVVLALWYRAGRGDPMIRSESIDGIGSTSYLDPAAGAGAAMPPTALAALSPFMNYAV